MKVKRECKGNVLLFFILIIILTALLGAVCAVITSRSFKIDVEDCILLEEECECKYIQPISCGNIRLKDDEYDDAKYILVGAYEREECKYLECHFDVYKDEQRIGLIIIKLDGVITKSCNSTYICGNRVIKK